MSKFKRRDFLKTSAVAAAGAAAGPFVWAGSAHAQWSNTPEKGAKLRVLRWKRFVQGDEDAYMANVKKFTEKTGIEVRVDHEGWEDVRPKAAVAANTGAGPDIILSTNDDANLYPGQARRRDRPLRVPRQEVRRLVPGVPAVPEAGRQALDRRAAGLPPAARSSTARARSRRPATRASRRTRRASSSLMKALKDKGTPGGLRARQRDRRRQHLDALARLVARRQARQRQEPGRHRQPRDGQGARVRQGALRDVRAGHAVVARPEQQQGVPRRPGQPHGERHLGLLRGQELDRPEDQGDDRRHQPRRTSRSGRWAGRPSSTCSSTR